MQVTRTNASAEELLSRCAPHGRDFTSSNAHAPRCCSVRWMAPARFFDQDADTERPSTPRLFLSSAGGAGAGVGGDDVV